MYGDMRHIFVMQSELENEVDLDDIQHSADKYSKAFNTHNNQRQMKAKKTVDKKNFRSDAEPYFRPAQRPSAINSKQKTKPPKIASNEPAESNVLLDNLIKSNIDALVEEIKIKDDSQNRATTKLTTTSSQPSSSTPSSSSSIKSKDDDNDQEEESKIEVTANVDKEVSTLFSNISSTFSSSSMTSTTETPIETSSFEMEKEESTEKLSSTLRNKLINKLDEELTEELLNDLETVASGIDEASSESDVLDRNNSKEPLTTTTETQLFQDTVQKEKEPAPVINRRGV